jgi:hypothetical protein
MRVVVMAVSDLALAGTKATPQGEAIAGTVLRVTHHLEVGVVVTQQTQQVKRRIEAR